MWRPVPRGAVVVRVDTSRRGARARARARARWEGYLLGAGVQERALAARMPPVVALGVHGDTTRVWGPPADRTPRSPALTRADVAVVARELEAAASEAGASVAAVHTLRPYGVAVAVRLAVLDPARFLAQRLPRFEHRLTALGRLGVAARPRKGQLDGLYIRIVDGAGRFAAAIARVDARGGTFVTAEARPGLAGCLHTYGRAPEPCPLETGR